MSLIEEFLGSPVISLHHFCGFPATEKREGTIGLKTGTLSVSEKKWRTRLPEEKTKYDMNEAGLYCFWWMGDYERINSAHKTHFLKGKKLGKDEHRMESNYHHLLEGKYIMHRLTWEFASNTTTGCVPLYVGKSSSVIRRIRLHLQWPRSAWPRYATPAVVGGVAKAGTVNTQTQFRKPFEYLFQDVSNDVERTRLLLENVGVSFITVPFHDVATRFFGEDELIGRLRPPFNLDAER